MQPHQSLLQRHLVPSTLLGNTSPDWICIYYNHITLVVDIHRQSNITGAEESQLALPLQMPDTGVQGARYNDTGTD